MYYCLLPQKNDLHFCKSFFFSSYKASLSQINQLETRKVEPIDFAGLTPI